MKEEIEKFIKDGDQEFKDEWDKSNSWSGGKFGCLEEIYTENDERVEFCTDEDGILKWHNARQIKLIELLSNLKSK